MVMIPIGFAAPAGLCALLVLASVSPAGAQSSDALDRVAFLNEMAAEQAEVEVEAALATYEAALVVLENDPEPDDLAIAAQLHLMGDYAADKLWDYGDTRAIGYLSRAFGIRRAALGEDHLDVAATQFSLGKAFLLNGDARTALRFLQEALETQEAGLPADHVHIAHTLSWLASAHQSELQLAEAEAFYQRSSAIFEAQLGAGSVDYGLDMMFLGEVYRDRGSAKEAEAAFSRARDALEPIAVDDEVHAADLAYVLGELAAIYRSTGRTARAEQYEARAAELIE